MIESVPLAVEALRAGGVVIVPTDTVYGLAVLADDEFAVERLYDLKQRAFGVPIAVLVADLDQATSIARFDAAALAAAEEFWPGPLTLVVPAHADPPRFAADDGTVGVRCPDHDVTRAVAAAAGPLATTSANRHGVPTPHEAAAAAAAFAGDIAVVIDTGPCTGAASTVATIGPPLVVHRDGSVSADALQACLDR